MLKNLFVPFFSTQRPGRAPGLAISQSIIPHARGTIPVKPQAGAGTSFTVVLPVAEERVTTPPPGDVPPMSSLEPPVP